MELLMAGTRGQAKDLLSIFQYENHIRKVVLFDDHSANSSNLLFGKYPILRSKEEAQRYFVDISPAFLSAIGSPSKRRTVTQRLISYGGEPMTFRSSRSNISDLSLISEEGVIILVHCDIGPEVVIEKGCLINVKVIIEPSVHIGEYTTVAPDVLIMEGARIGKNCIISTGVIIMPGVQIGNNVKVWMNKIVTTDLPDNTNFL